MLIKTPSRKARKIAKHLIVIRVEDVGAVAMDQNPGFIEGIRRVSPGVSPFVDEAHSHSQDVRQALREGSTCEPAPYDKVIERAHITPPFFCKVGDFLSFFAFSLLTW